MIKDFLRLIIASFGVSILVLVLSSTCVNMESQLLANTQKTIIQAAGFSPRVTCYSFAHHDDERVPNYPTRTTTIPPYNSLASIGTTGPVGTTTTTL